MGIIKLFLTLLFLPALVGTTQAFCAELAGARALVPLFWYGILTYVVTHLFVVNFQGVYQGGQKIFSDGLKFSPFLSSFVPLIIPLFPLVLLISFFICMKFFAMREWEPHFIFFSGLTFAMHLILTAQILREEDTSIFKTHYFLVMSLGYVFNLLIIASLLDLNFNSFSFARFVQESWGNIKVNYYFIYIRLLRP